MSILPQRSARSSKTRAIASFLQQWDFANRNLMERMHAALRVIALLSPAYFKSDACMAEALNAIGHDPLNKKRRLIAMRIVVAQRGH